MVLQLLTGVKGVSGSGGISGKVGLDTLTISGYNDNDEDAAVQLGKYLAPGLYVGYGVGLVNKLSTIVIRYKLSDIWTVRTESGEETGADLLFTHER